MTDFADATPPLLVRVTCYVEVSSFGEPEELADAIRKPDTPLELSGTTRPRDSVIFSSADRLPDPEFDDHRWGRD